jgi:alpha-tubulin suppressor-like RCC1 family protein
VAADVGNPIRCVVTGTNAVGNSSANSNATANISAIAPDAPTIGTATTTGLTTATVSFTAPAIDGGATITTYTATSSPGDITGTLSQAGSGTINVTGLTSGTSYTFTVTATNSAGTGSASAASNSITTFTIPVNTVAPVVSGTATVGQVLTTTNGTWTGTATITFTYQWQRNNVNIGSATASTYTLVSADIGNPIRCVVTGTNSYGNSSANSNATANISAIAPDAPTIGTATVTGSTTATVSFTAPASDGGATITTYTATSSPGGITGTLNQAGSGTITVSGLSASTSYTFTVTATNSAGTSAASAASNSITTPLAGNIWTWGNNTNNWLSVGLGGNQSNPVQLVSNANDWAAISAGGRQSTGIKTDGTYWAWGGNSYGQLGDDTNISKTSPVQTVAGGTNWSIPAAGSNASGGIKTDGTLWTWGKNFFGVLGNDSQVAQVSSPVQTVAGGTNWSYLSIPNQTAVALKTDGTLWSWGRATSGALGDLSSITKSSPVQTVAGGTNWRQATIGGFFFTLAIKTDGTLWGWGNNANGTLGNNSTGDVSSPIQTVASGTNWQQVSAGYKSVAAIKTDGTLWTWGQNNYGQLGDNSVIQRNSPVQTVSGGTVWSVVSAGNTGMTASIKTDGTLWTWGRNNSGQLGDGTIAQRNSPVQTSRGGTDWKRISVGPADTTVGLKMVAIVG